MSPGVLYVRRRNARRYILRVDDEGMVRVTIPRGGSMEYAKKFTDRHAEWIAGQIRKRQEKVEARDSEKSVMFRGENVPLLIDGNGVSFGEHKLLMEQGEDLRLRIREKMFELAKAELP